MTTLPCEMMAFKHLRVCVAGLDHGQIDKLTKAIRQILILAKNGRYEGHQVTQWGGFYNPEGNVSHPCGCPNCRGASNE